MNVLLIVSTFVLCLYGLSPVDCAQAQEKPSPNRKPNGCYSETVGHLIREQEKNVDGKCMQAYCAQDGSITYSTCGLVQVPAKCILDEPDLSKPYPLCCPQVKC